VAQRPPGLVSLSSLWKGRWVGVAGTGANKKDNRWWLSDSAFSKYLLELGYRPLRSDAFVWSTDLDGFWAGHSDWDAAGAALTYYFAHTRAADRNVICHSHGLQAVLYACGKYGLEINSLTSVCSPIRKDMEELAGKARSSIGYWTHIHSDWSDRTQILGSLWDGAFGIVRTHPLADINVKIPGVGHSDLLKKPSSFFHWDGLIYPLSKTWLETILPRSKRSLK
jgi:hypothetical protein